MGEPSRAVPLLTSLLKDQRTNIRYSAALSLGTMGQSAKAAVPQLIPLLQDSNALVRFTTVNTLQEIGESA